MSLFDSAINGFKSGYSKSAPIAELLVNRMFGIGQDNDGMGTPEYNIEYDKEIFEDVGDE